VTGWGCAQAVREGRWIVIEDIDLAPLEILSVLIPLLETRKLFIPGRGEVIYAPKNFQLFATQTLYGSSGGSVGQNGTRDSASSRFAVSYEVNHSRLTLLFGPFSSAVAAQLLDARGCRVALFRGAWHDPRGQVPSDCHSGPAVHWYRVTRA
jgi:hypothetical protein